MHASVSKRRKYGRRRANSFAPSHETPGRKNALLRCNGLDNEHASASKLASLANPSR
jgi:hypothetical protein